MEEIVNLNILEQAYFSQEENIHEVVPSDFVGILMEASFIMAFRQEALTNQSTLMEDIILDRLVNNFDFVLEETFSFQELDILNFIEDIKQASLQLNNQGPLISLYI